MIEDWNYIFPSIDNISDHVKIVIMFSCKNSADISDRNVTLNKS